MASTYATAVTPVQVGNYFVGQYYQVLQATPEYVHQFYTDTSSVTRIDGNAVNTVSATLEIHNLIMSLNFTAIEIKTAHSMESWGGGVLVTVSGFVQTKEFSGRRNFVQTFFLAPQDKGYFVLNDIFQFIEEEHSHEQPSSSLAHEHYDSELAVANPLQEPVDDRVLEGDIEGDEYASDAQAEESEGVDEYNTHEPSLPVPEADNRVDEEVIIEEPSVPYSRFMSSTRDPPPAVFEEPIEEPIKHTYASILRSKANFGQSQHQSFLPKTIPVASEWDHIPQQPPLQSYPLPAVALEKPNVEVAEEISLDDEVGEVTSVYVRNLSSSISAADLEKEFKNFGRIKPDGVLIKSRKEAGIYYAFVEFEDLSGVQNAVKASPILFNGRQIYAEERRLNAGASRGRGRGRGRGSYLSDSLRGRFGGRSLARGNTQDNNARDYNGKSRGNGYPQRGTRQERGALLPQSRNGHYSDFTS